MLTGDSLDDDVLGMNLCVWQKGTPIYTTERAFLQELFRADSSTLNIEPSHAICWIQLKQTETLLWFTCTKNNRRFRT